VGLCNEAPTWEDRQQRERAIIQLIRAGNNLNQIARQLNSQRGTISYSNLEQTLKTLKAVLQDIEGIMPSAVTKGAAGRRFKG